MGTVPESSFVDIILDNAYFGVAVGVALVFIHALMRSKDIFGITKKSKLSKILLLYIFFALLVIVAVYMAFDVNNSKQGMTIGLGITSTLLNISKDRDFYNED